VPSKSQTRGPALKQPSSPCPDITFLGYYISFRHLNKNVHANPVSSLLLFHIYGTDSETLLPSNQPSLEFHWDKTVTTFHWALPSPWINQESREHKKDLWNGAPPINCTYGEAFYQWSGLKIIACQALGAHFRYTVIKSNKSYSVTDVQDRVLFKRDYLSMVLS
jgi:hypothetical protein